MSHRARFALLILICTGIYLIGNDRVPLWDRDEPRNAQAARQMLQSGDWVVPHFLDQVRTAKPPFTYWLQASAMSLFGDNAFAARFPSAIAMALTLAVLAFALVKWTDPDRAFWTVFILATSAIVIAWSARTSMTDAVLLLWITIAQLCLYAILRGGGSWKVVIAMAIAIGCAILTKGPVVLGVMAMTLVMLGIFRFFSSMAVPAMPPRHGRDAHATIKAITAIAIVAIIVAPWVILVERRAPGFIRVIFSHDVFQRVFEPLEQHYGPPGYYLLLIWALFFPWCVLLPLAFVVAFRHWRVDPKIRFALAAVIGPWLMFELVRTKLPHYLLPALPPLAYLTADAVVRCLRGEHKDLDTAGTRGGITIWALFVATVGFFPLIATWQRESLPFDASIALTAAGVLYAVIVFGAFMRRSLDVGLAAMGLGMMLVMSVTFGWYLPQVDLLRLSPCIAEALQHHHGGAKETKAGDVQMIAYKEPSLAFDQGGTIREQPENDFLLTHPPAQWPSYLVIRNDVWERMPKDVKDKWELIGTCRGLDIAGGMKISTVMALRKRAAGEGAGATTVPASTQPAVQ